MKEGTVMRKLDHVDIAILACLYEDPCMTNKAIAEAVKDVKWARGDDWVHRPLSSGVHRGEGRFGNIWVSSTIRARALRSDSDANLATACV